MDLATADRELAAGFAGPAFQLSDKHARAPEYVTLSDTAMQIGRQSACADRHLFAAWLDLCPDERAMTQEFGPISVSELLRDVLLNPGATGEQLKQACAVLRTRYLTDEAEYVLTTAQRAMEL